MLKTTSNKNKSFTMHVQRPSLTKESVQSMIDNSIQDKLDKTTTPQRVYATSTTGEQIKVIYTPDTEGFAIVSRLSSGHVKVPETPDKDYHATSKKYVDAAKADALAEADKVAKRVDKLENLLITYSEDDSDAYEKSVPEASAQRAILSYVGGASRVVKSKNLCTNAKEGGIALSSDGDYIDTGFSYTLPAGTYTASCSVEGELDRMEIWVYDEMYLETTTFTLSEESRVSISVLAYGSSAIAFPMINEGTTALPYEPYFEPYIESAPVTAIVTEGKNLVNDVAIFEEFGFAKQSNGFWYGSSFTKRVYENLERKEGVITVSYFGYQDTSTSTHFTFAIKYTDGTTDYQGNMIAGAMARNISFSTNPTKIVDRISTSYGTKGAFYIKDLMINWGAPVDYKPYFNKTYEIPEAIRQKCDSYGCGISADAYNYIDYDRKVYVQKCKKLVLDGVNYKIIFTNTLSSTGVSYGTMTVSERAKSETSIICSHFKTEVKIALGNCYFSGNADALKTVVFVHPNQDMTTTAEWNAWLASNPVTVVYELAEPIETDISAYLTDYEDYKFIEVEGGGTVRFENEHKMDISSSIIFAEV